MSESTIKKGDFQNPHFDRCIYILERKDFSKNIYVIQDDDYLVIVTLNADKIQSYMNYLMQGFLLERY